MRKCLTGAPVTVASENGVRLFDAAIESYLASRADTPVLLKQAVSEDPDHLMAGCFLGYLTRLAGDRRNATRSAELHRNLAAAAAAGAGTDWERSHVEALGLWQQDHLHALMRHLESMLDVWPQDILALRMLHYLYFYDGDSVRMRDGVAARLPAYREHRLESYVLGMLSFGHEEAGDYGAAERLGREAVEREPEDAWAAHAVAHVMHMQGRATEGIRWIDGLRGHWERTNNFRFHLFWHQALYHLAERQMDAALDLYDRDVGPAVEDDFYLDLCNAASLLMRLEAAGVDVGERWAPLVRIAELHVEDTELVFASLHYLMPLVRTRSPTAGRLLSTLEQWADRETTQGRLMRQVGLEVAALVTAVETADVEAMQRRFSALRGRLHRIGGSHAQRELFEILARAAEAGSVHH